jgi:hypothetical protein
MTRNAEAPWVAEAVELTLTWQGRKCWWAKEFGGHDGYYFLGIPVPISNCSP